MNYFSLFHYATKHINYNYRILSHQLLYNLNRTRHMQLNILIKIIWHMLLIINDIMHIE